MDNPYINLSRIRAALRTLDLRPSRGMGQNFLLDPYALGRIVAAADLSTDDTVLEVGPGLGVLTWELLRRAGRVVAVELDKRLAARLHEEFASDTHLTIVQNDILRVAPDEVVASVAGPTEPYKVVANLPYAITSPVLRHLLEAGQPPTLIVVLVQWEVAQRIAAGPGNLSVLAHSVQIYAEPEVMARVEPGSFLPRPEVDSAVLRLRVRPHPALQPGDDINRMLRVVKAGFLHTRKKLSNGLPSGLAAMGIKLEKEQVLEALTETGIDASRRAETVTLEEWLALYRLLNAA